MSDEELRRKVKGTIKLYYDNGVLLSETVDEIVSIHQQELERAVAEATPKTICGYTIKEAVTILNGLNIERATGIAVTMKNLDKLYKKLQEDLLAAHKMAMERTFDSITNKKEGK